VAIEAEVFLAEFMEIISSAGDLGAVVTALKFIAPLNC